MSFIMLRNDPSKLTSLRIFIMNGCCILSNTFSASIEIMFLILSFIDVMYHIDSFVNIEPHLQPRSKSLLIVVNVFLMYLIDFPLLILLILRIFASICIRDIGLQFSFLVVTLLGFGVRVMLVS